MQKCRRSTIALYVYPLGFDHLRCDASGNGRYSIGSNTSIQKDIIIRTRRDGDKIIPLGMSGNKKIKDIFINMKIPKEQREIIPLVCLDNKISWIVGLRVSDEYKVTSDTKKILRVIAKRKEH